MLVIDKGQVQAFEQAALRHFTEQMVIHSRQFSPRLCEVLGDTQLRLAVHSAIARATAYRLANRGPIRLFVEMMFLFGSAFDTDPQYPALGQALRAPGDEMERAQRLHEWALAYHEKVCGAGAANVHRSLRQLSVFARLPLDFSSHEFVPAMLQEMHIIFPQKAAYVGAEALTRLIEEARTQARRNGLAGVRPQALIVALMFAFGHGCTGDPLYPWIAQTLNDERIVDPAARAARLERKALTWLEHVNAGNEKKTGA